MAYATIDELADALRTTVTADNTARLQACIDAAAVEIDDALCRTPDDPVDPTNPLLNRVNLMRPWNGGRPTMPRSGGWGRAMTRCASPDRHSPGTR